MTTIERMAAAISSVKLFSRFNDFTDDRFEGLPIEICRYGREREPEIVVLGHYPPGYDEREALAECIAEERALAALKALREPSEGMIAAAWGEISKDKAKAGIARLGPGPGAADWWRAMIDAAISEAEGGS
jgi:hypothetical protein